MTIAQVHKPSFVDLFTPKLLTVLRCQLRRAIPRFLHGRAPKDLLETVVNRNFRFCSLHIKGAREVRAKSHIGGALRRSSGHLVNRASHDPTIGLIARRHECSRFRIVLQRAL